MRVQLKSRYSPGQKIIVDSSVSRLSRLRRRVHAWSNALSDQAGRLVMLTLTYSPEYEWSANDIRGFMLRLREACPQLLAYAWVAELQQRGAVHYHVLLLVPRGVLIPEPDSSGLWYQGSSRVETARSKFYICKYVQKSCTCGNYPKGCRIFAVFISKRCLADFHSFRLSAFPLWLQESLSLLFDGSYPSRATGGGWWLMTEFGPVKLLSEWVFDAFLDD